MIGNESSKSEYRIVSRIIEWPEIKVAYTFDRRAGRGQKRSENSGWYTVYQCLVVLLYRPDEPLFLGRSSIPGKYTILVHPKFRLRQYNPGIRGMWIWGGQNGIYTDDSDLMCGNQSKLNFSIASFRKSKRGT